MPTYEYKCEACDFELEISQSISDLPIKKCPDCKKLKLQRQISAPGLVFKGSDWTPKYFDSPTE